MKVSRIAIIAAAGLAFAAPAWADWGNLTLGEGFGYQGIGVGSSYIAVDANNDPVPLNQVNDNGTFKPGCNQCSWREKSAGDPAASANSAQHWSPNQIAVNPVTGNASGWDANGFSSTNGTSTTVVAPGGVATTNGVNATVVLPQGIVTSGAVVAPTMVTQDSLGNSYHVGDTLNAHSALLSDHTARLDEHAKGLAIAMALPDLYLSDKERFSIAGNLGGFGDETALGFGAIARIDQTFALTGKVGTDTEFKEFGWSVGARAGF